MKNCNAIESGALESNPVNPMFHSFAGFLKALGLIKISLSVLLLMFATAVANAAAEDEEVTFPELREAIAKQLPDVIVTSLEDTPIAGVYELISQGKIYYVSEDARFVFDGMLIDLQTRQNLTNERLSGIHIGLINAMDESEMLIYEPEEKSDRSITVFTDTSCGYCRKLHAELDTLLESGVRVRYLMFPRAGIDSPSHKQLESIWCADDPQAAMTTAKAGGSVQPGSCENPIHDHMALAEQVGLRGTPLIYLDTGQQVPGYRAAAELVEMVKAGTPVTE